MDEHDRIEARLEELHLDPKWRGRYWTIHCPIHEDRNKSAVCFGDGWLHCFAGCPRRHINSLGKSVVDYQVTSTGGDGLRKASDADFTDLWLELSPLTEPIKGIPPEVLNAFGWRLWPDNYFGLQGGAFIPYFNPSKTKVRFYQIRHLEGDRRFTFARNCQPICYGLECLKDCRKFLVFTEGSRDSIILRMAGIPAIALPSASSGAMLKRMGRYATEHGLILVSVSDRDVAGDKLLSNIPGPFIDMRTPIGKDVGDFYAEKGLDEVKKYYQMLRKENK